MMSGHHLRYGCKNFINIDFEIGYLDYPKLKLQLRIFVFYVYCENK